MTSNLPQDLLDGVMRLPDAERAALAAALIESLDEAVDVDEDVEASWSAEIARRLRAVDDGSVTTIPWPEARRLIASDG